MREALRAHQRRIAQVWLLAGSPRLSGLQRLAERHGVPVALVDRAQLNQLAGDANHQGAACDGPALELHSAERALEAHQQLVLALDGIQDPQNFGAIVRSAVGLGGAWVLWGEHGAAPLTTATFRASAGAIEHAQLCRVPSLAQWLMDAQARGFQVLGLDAEGKASLREWDLMGPTVLVLGGEGRGLSRGVRRHCTHLVRLVPPGKIDSLNASVAAALALYEAQCQRASLPNPPPIH